MLWYQTWCQRGQGYSQLFIIGGWPQPSQTLTFLLVLFVSMEGTILLLQLHRSIYPHGEWMIHKRTMRAVRMRHISHTTGGRPWTHIRGQQMNDSTKIQEWERLEARRWLGSLLLCQLHTLCSIVFLPVFLLCRTMIPCSTSHKIYLLFANISRE